MKVEGIKLTIQASRYARRGWEEHFSVMVKKCDDQLMDEPHPIDWDEEEWTRYFSDLMFF